MKIISYSLAIHQLFNYQKKQIQPHHTLDSPNKNRNRHQRDETTRDARRKKERRKNRVIPDPKTREAASLANAVALPVAVHKTPTPMHQLCISYSLAIHQLFTSYSLAIHQLFISYSLAIHQLFISYSQQKNKKN